jgi:predicted CopG family antitoxin
MSRASIPVDAETKQRLRERKRDDETFDDFLRRVALADERIEAGAWTDAEAEAAKEAIRNARQSWD